MNQVFIGKVVNTHGIKGEIRILSDFEYKDRVFVVGGKILINNQEFIINSYRVHKNFDMVTLKGFDDINQVIPFKGRNVFVNREQLGLNKGEYLLEDLIGMTVKVGNDIYGNVVDYSRGQNSLLEVNYEDKTYYIPMRGNFIEDISYNEGIIFASDEVKGLIL